MSTGSTRRIGPDDGMPQRCVVSLDNLQTIRKAHFGALIVHLSSERMRQVRAAMEFALGFNEMR
jgi:mRNA-degrading endonuclease toxin of MazEF toxin-antitoxin module